MASAPERRPVNNWLIELISTLDILTGKLVAPEGGGWASDSAKVGAEFTPYSVITPHAAHPQNPTIDDYASEWAMPFLATTYGVDADQVEDLADLQRKLLSNTKKVRIEMSDSSWRVTDIKCTSIGGVGYTVAVEPTAFSQSDAYTLTLSRSLT